MSKKVKATAQGPGLRKIRRPKLDNITIFESTPNRFAFQVHMKPGYVIHGSPVPEFYVESVGLLDRLGFFRFILANGHAQSIVTIIHPGMGPISFIHCVSDTDFKSTSVEDYIQKVVQAQAEIIRNHAKHWDTAVYERMRTNMDFLHSRERIAQTMRGHTQFIASIVRLQNARYPNYLADEELQ